MDYVEIFLKEVCKNREFTYVGIDNSLVLLPREDLSFYMPKIFIEDRNEFEKVLSEYVATIMNSSLEYYTIDGLHSVGDYLFYLVKSLSNEDCLDFIGYIRRAIDFIKDETFSDLKQMKLIGKVGIYDLLAKRSEEFYGSETPFTMRFYLRSPHFRFAMPLVRYGIIEDKVAYLYCVQRKKMYGEKVQEAKKINKLLNSVNRGIKENRNITPSMLCSLAAFLGMLKSEGIEKVLADGFLPRRYGYFNEIWDEEGRNRVLANSVDKYFRLYQRLVEQSTGVDIKAYPLDVDSYMHVVLSDELKSENELLNQFYSTSKSYSMSKKQ